MFLNCINLISVKLPNSVTEIGNGAFKECKNLQSIDIHDTVTTIGDKAFKDCESLVSIKIPKNVEINFTAFDNTFSSCLNKYPGETPTNIIKKLRNNDVTIICNCEIDDNNSKKCFNIPEETPEEDTSNSSKINIWYIIISIIILFIIIGGGVLIYVYSRYRKKDIIK